MAHQQCCDIHGRILYVELRYPRISDVDTIQVGLQDVRAADDLQISYDFQRDGWSIKQASVPEAQDTDEQDWQEVAFVEA